MIKDNGLSLLSIYQYFEFDLIKVLQEANMSLKEIKAFMIQRNNQTLLIFYKKSHRN